MLLVFSTDQGQHNTFLFPDNQPVPQTVETVMKTVAPAVKQFSAGPEESIEKKRNLPVDSHLDNHDQPESNSDAGHNPAGGS